MTLVRVWRRQLLGGMSMAVIVPATLIASLAVLGAAGGFAGLTALGQALSGPSTPVSTLATSRAGQSARPVPAALAAALSAPAARPLAPGQATPTAHGGGAPTSSGPATPSAPRAPGQGSGGGTHAPSGTGRSPTPAPAPKPQPQPKPQPTLTDRIVGVGTSVTEQVPGPAGAAATETLQTAGATLDSIAPIKSR
jgi:hypothetical protein